MVLKTLRSFIREFTFLSFALFACLFGFAVGYNEVLVTGNVNVVGVAVRMPEQMVFKRSH